MAWDDDPFANDSGDRTIIRPSPGGRPGAGPRPAPAQAPQPDPVSPAAPGSQAGSAYPPAGRAIPASAQAISRLSGSGLNSLIDAATTLLALASKLRSTVSHDNVAGLQGHVIQQIRLFEDAARSSGCEQDSILTARYLLCTYLDESVLKTPWGSKSEWASQSLLSKFHDETWGGEKFFQVAERMLQDPVANLNLLELIYLCLSFGFQGRYAVAERGETQLLEFQQSLYRTIAMQRGEFERELSPHWQGVEDSRNALVKYVPLWVVAALAGVLLLVVYGGFRFILSTTSAPVYSEIEQALSEQRVDLSD